MDLIIGLERVTNALLGLFYHSDTPNAVASEEIEDNTVIRSRSSDLLKKSPTDTNAKKSHFNSLKQWGKNRLKMMGRSPSTSRDNFRDSKTEKSKEILSIASSQNDQTQEAVTMRKKRTGEEDRRTHQRCASYSSSEKSIGVPTNSQTTATISAGVKLRGTATQRRSRKSGIARDEPHSSSGNWSASSESGRTSIASEITTTTVPPKSSTSAATSNNSLNLNHHGPPSSIISRRKFLNTSGSGSVTSEGTLTPDIIHDLHEDLETSSEFSCDTEGYYTSFHMDSGLKTLKEEEMSPSTPLHTTTALSNSSNSQNLSAENEYELFGKGSTSTTTSSAGTVCTTLMAGDSDRSLIIGPTVPERKSSLTKITRSRGNLERSSSSSFSRSPFTSLRYTAMRSYADKQSSNQSAPEINLVPSNTVTITGNVGSREITAVAEVHTEADLESAKKSTGTNSPDSGHNTSSSPIEDSVSSAHGKNSLSEQDYSESSDLEGTDRIERIRFKTTINSSRIPSMCVITPTNSDDESETSYKDSERNRKQETTVKNNGNLTKSSSRPKLDLPNEEKQKETRLDVKSYKPQNQLKSSLHPFNNFMCKLKGVLPNKLSTKKSPVAKDIEAMEDFYDSGDYVTIADVKNNNQKVSMNRGNYANNDIVRKNLQAVLSGKLPETEYVSLNELPNCLSEGKDYVEHSLDQNQVDPIEEIQRKGAKVTLDSQGQVIYSSDTLKRRKGAHTTFEPGPFVQEICPTTTIIQRECADVVKITDETDFPYEPPPPPSSKPTSPQLGKMIIKAPINPLGIMTKEFVTLPAPKPSTIIAAMPVTAPPVINNNKLDAVANRNKEPPRVVEAITRTGAYVNIHDADGVSLSPTKDDNTGKTHISSATITCDANKPNVESYDRLIDNEDIVPFVPNFQTSIILKNKHHNNVICKPSSKVAEVMKMFTNRNNDENVNSSINSGNLDKNTNSKIKRSDSYKLANSPLMPIKKLLKLDSFNNSKKGNSFELIQAEITADLLREQINYPSTVSPILNHKNSDSELNNCECIQNNNNRNSFIDDNFESELSALTLSPLATPLPKRHTIASIPDNRDRAMDMLNAILDSDPDNVCVLHAMPACPLTPLYLSKVTVPYDGPMHRARILSISETEYGTEIW